MAEEEHEVRRIHWNEVFSFPEIFKGFKLAIHPSKLILAMAAIILIFLTGWVMDRVWSWGDQPVRPNEISAHFATSGGKFAQDREEWKDARRGNAAELLKKARVQERKLREYIGIEGTKGLRNIKPGCPPFLTAFAEKLDKENEGVWDEPNLDEIKKKDDTWSEMLDKADKAFKNETEKIGDLLEPARKAAEKAIEDTKFDKDDSDRDDELKEAALDRLDRYYVSAKRALSERKAGFAAEKKAIRGGTIFASLADYELQCLWNAISAVRYGNITGGMEDYRTALSGKAIQPVTVAGAQAVGQGPRPANDRPGLLFWVLMGFHAIIWLICEHWLYAAIFLVVSLAIWALFGGAIHRIAALHATREEKISIAQALRFSFGKFLSFFTAPLIPLAIILFCGGVLAVGGAAFGTWGGGIVMGLLFFLALIMGFVIAFLLVGLAGGGGLMYPTIAVEGSDSFDAISRSFSYVFARPFRAAFYGLVALVYGVITYLFVRLFAWLALTATHTFVKWGVFANGDGLGPDADKLDVIWTKPQFDSLFGPFSWDAMSGMEQTGAFIIGIWVFLVAAAVAAYLLSYFASSTTTIYLLLRRKVDATDLDDVYVEEEEEPFVPAEPQETPAEEGSADQTPAEDKPVEDTSKEDKAPEEDKTSEDESTKDESGS